MILTSFAMFGKTSEFFKTDCSVEFTFSTSFVAFDDSSFFFLLLAAFLILFEKMSSPEKTLAAIFSTVNLLPTSCSVFWAPPTKPFDIRLSAKVEPAF